MGFNILILSAKSPHWSLNLGVDYVEAFKLTGCNVDYVGVPKYSIQESGYHSLGKTIFDRKESAISKCIHKITSLHLFRVCIDRIRYNVLNKKIGQKIHFLHLDDSQPATTWEEWYSAIPKKRYDLIITTHLGGDITSITIGHLAEEFKCPILMMAVDMQPMTGGCFYFNECREFLNQCKNCKAIYELSKDISLPNKNFILKKNIYHKYPVFVGVNSYMNEWFKSTGIWQNNKYLNIGCVINETIFKPEDKVSARHRLGLPDKRFVIFAGSHYLFEERKGLKLLIEAVQIFLREHRECKIVLVLAGLAYGKKVNIPGVIVKQVGLLNLTDMISMYSAADVFACSSLDDAGPSMINQSIMCNTPVLAFDTGVAKDIVINNKTGYKAILGNVYDFSKGLAILYKANREGGSYKYGCRNFAIENFSRQSIANKIINECLKQ